MQTVQLASAGAPNLGRRSETNPASFEAAWKLARVDYWLGGHAPEPERRGFLESGIEAARKALRSNPIAPKGTSGSPPTWARLPSRSAFVPG